MGSIAKFRKKQVGFLAAAIMATVNMPTAMALPLEYEESFNVNIKAGEALVNPGEDVGGKDVDVILTNGTRGAIEWKNFNIDEGCSINFSSMDKSSGWAVLNRVTGTDMSVINGHINGQGGSVFLVNPHGILFGKTASVDVGSFVASTLWTDRDEFLNGNSNECKFVQKDDVAGARITNLGNIKASDDGMVALLAHQVVSGGEITTGEDGSFKDAVRMDKMNSIEAGQVVMAAGKEITLELQYDDKIGVRLNEKALNNGVTINTPSADYDFVINASDVTANRGVVLMKASAAREIGSNLICQTGVVTANVMTQDEGGNIILKAENVNAGGTLTANGKNAKIGIYGNSLVSAEAKAMDEGGVIEIDSGVYQEGGDYGGANIALAGARLYAENKITTRSNHSVIVVDGADIKGESHDTVVSAVKKDGTPGDWDIIASKVKVDSTENLTMEDYDLKALQDQQIGNVYKVSNKVLGKTLENTNVNIKTGQFDGHYVYSEEAIANNNLGVVDATGDNDIEINADIEKQGGQETTLTITPFNKENDHVSADADLFKDGKIVLNADIISTTAPLNVTLTATDIALDKARSDSTVRISTPGSHEHGTVKITGRVARHIFDGPSQGATRNLIINAGDTVIDASAGGVEVNDLEIYSQGNIDVTGQVNACNNVIARAAENPHGDYLDALYDAEGKPAYNKNYNVTFHDAIKAGKTISLSADEDVTIEDTIQAGAENNDRAVEIAAQRNFNNDVCVNNNYSVVTAGSSSWKIYSTRPEDDRLGKLYSNHYAGWGWGNDGFSASIDGDPNKGYRTPGVGNRYIFKHTPILTYTPDSVENKPFGTTVDAKDVKYTVTSDMSDVFQAYFDDAIPVNIEAFKNSPAVRNDDITTDSEGYKAEASLPRYDINMINVPGMIGGYKTVKNTGAVTITVPIVRNPESPVPPATDETPEPPVTPATDETPAAPMTPVVTENPVVPVAPAEPEIATVNPGEKPQMDALTTSNLSGTASITEAQKAQGPSADRVLGLQTAELPFFNEKNGIVKLYGTYDVTVDPDKVQMEATAKVLPEPDQPANQYRELTMRLATANGNLKFLLTYNGTVLDIYPTDKAAEKALVSGDSKKNEEIESKALFEAFNYMGITLDDLDAVYTHFAPLM